MGFFYDKGLATDRFVDNFICIFRYLSLLDRELQEH